tara:strand:+ start:1425 stop:1676 length:252 start_codon:yes stop_codon:yes gene_type:complete
MDQKFLKYILSKCEVDINILSKKTGIKYQYLYQVFYSNRKLKDYELEVLSCYLKKKTTLSNHYIEKRINKIKGRNYGDIKGDR